MNKLYNFFNLYDIGFSSKEDLLNSINNFNDTLRLMSDDVYHLVNFENNSTTPLIQAIHTNDLDIIKSTLALPYIDINYQTEGLKSALLEAVREDSDAVIHYLLSHPQIDIEAKFKFGEGLAFKLANHNKFEILKDLIENRNLSFNYESKIGHNILHKVVQAGNIEMCQYFLDKGININQISREPKAPIDIAISQNDFTMMNFLLPLIDAKQHNHSFKLSLLEFKNKQIEEFMFNSSLCNVASLTEVLNDSYWKKNTEFRNFEKKIQKKFEECKIIEEKDFLNNIISSTPIKAKKIKM